MTDSPILLILDALACYRLVRLILLDAVTEPLRRALIGQVKLSERLLDGSRMTMAARPRLAELLHCPWCVSIWCAIGVVLLQSLLPTACLYLTAVLAFSTVAGIISERV